MLCDNWERENGVQCSSGSLPLSVICELECSKGMRPVLREAISRMAKKEEIVIDFERFKTLCSLLKHPSEGKIIEIAKGFSFQVKNGTLLFGRNPESALADYFIDLQVGENPIPHLPAVLKLSDTKQGKVININKKSLIIHAASDRIEGKLFVRNRKNGDSLRIGGMTKSVKKLFNEAKIPVDDRDRFPLVCDDKGIVWIPGVGLCDRVRNSKTGEIFTMELIVSTVNENKRF